MDQRLAKRPVVCTALFVVYVATGLLALRLASVNPSASAFWPPAGLSVAAVVLFGRGVWPGVFAGAFVVNVITTGVWWSSFVIAGGNTLEALVAGALILRFADGPKAFQSVGSSLRVAALAGLFGTTISASIGVATLALAGLAKWSDFSYVWMTWWFGDLTGCLVFTPAVLLWAASPRPDSSSSGSTSSRASFSTQPHPGRVVRLRRLYPSDVKTYPLEFLCGPFVGRLGSAGARSWRC